MPDLAWQRFRELGDDPRRNWELLCREVVRRNYEAFGRLLTQKQQPGVEFYLPIERPGCELGEPGRCWGWQCRWYEADAFHKGERRLTAAQRQKIEEAIKKSAKHVEGLTDWVLWTRQKLGAEDARWFAGLEARFTLRRWDEETLVGLLAGDAAPLRGSWFGELILDEQKLRRCRREALAPVAHRYEEDLHIRTPPEVGLETILPGSALGSKLERKAERLRSAATLLSGAGSASDSEETRALQKDVVSVLNRVMEAVHALRTGLEAGRLPSSAEARGALTAEKDLEGRLDAHLRRERTATPGFSDAHSALWESRELLEALAVGLEVGVLAVLGGAGAGKTHLAAHLTGPDESPRGVLALGRQFSGRVTEQDIVRHVGFGEDLEQLVEGLEALGLRRGRRVILMIDGLNESDQPDSWKQLLPRLETKLKRFRHVLAVVTLRPSYAEIALPPLTRKLELAGFRGLERTAVTRYFAHYRIRADMEAIAWWRPTDPLLLSIFCRTVNPGRERSVSAAELPGSLATVLASYLEDVFGRVAEAMELLPEEVRSAVARLSAALFRSGQRELGRAAAAAALGDSGRGGWKHSMLFQMESEEVLVRDAFDGEERVGFGYDRLAGQAIADDLLVSRGVGEIAAEPLTTLIAEHPLVEDIVAGLAGKLAATGHEPCGALGPNGALSSELALASVRLRAEAVGDATEAALAAAFAERPGEVLEALAAHKLRPEYPLNARFLDSLLGGLAVWERDLLWSEWVRGRAEALAVEVDHLWRKLAEPGAGPDREAALVWLSWLLTSTVKPLRDRAIRALYRLGRRDPELLFTEALTRLRCNDPAVAEGAMAAAYGVVMAAQTASTPTRAAVTKFATELRARLLGRGASEPTSHWLIREYAYRTLQLAAILSEGQIEPPGEPAQPPLPAPPGEAPAFAPGEAGWEAVDGAFHMDFANYTVGRLVEERANYDFEQPGFVRVSGEIRARVHELGWRKERFDVVDREIANQFTGRSSDPEKTERYGKKYSWAGFYEAAGRLSDAGKLRAEGPTHEGWRISDVPIDPSFPVTITMPAAGLPEWVPEDGEDEDWARHGLIEIPDRLLRRTDEKGAAWIALDGYLRCEPQRSTRKAFCFIRGLLALEGWDSVAAYLAEHPPAPELIASNPTDYYCFAGETPWAATFDNWATAADGSTEAQTEYLDWHREDGPQIELLSVEFGWESYHSVLNDAEIGALPSKALCRFAGLRKPPAIAEFLDAEGRLAARSLVLRSPPWHGHLLWVREEVLEAYCRERCGQWGWVAWGEREVWYPEIDSDQLPAWLGEVRRQGLDRFSRVASLAELQAAAQALPPGRTRH